MSAVEKSEAGFDKPGAAQQRIVSRIVQANEHCRELAVGKHQAPLAVLAGREDFDRLEGDLRAIPTAEFSLDCPSRELSAQAVAKQRR